MEKIIRLEDDVEIKRNDEGYEINVNNKWLIKISNSDREFSFERMLKEEKTINAGNNIKNIDLIGFDERKLVRNWSYDARFYTGYGFEKELKKAIAIIEDDFWVVETHSFEDKKIAMEICKRDLTIYETDNPSVEELAFWLAYKIEHDNWNYNELRKSHFEVGNNIFILRRKY